MKTKFTSISEEKPDSNIIVQEYYLLSTTSDHYILLHLEIFGPSTSQSITLRITQLLHVRESSSSTNPLLRDASIYQESYGQ